MLERVVWDSTAVKLSHKACHQFHIGHLYRETRVRQVIDDLWILEMIEGDMIVRTEFAPDEPSIREIDGSVRVRLWVRGLSA